MDNTAYVVVASNKKGEIIYYYRDFDHGFWRWTDCVFKANLYTSYEEALVGKKRVVNNKDDFINLNQVWIEKLTTITIPEDEPEQVKKEKKIKGYSH